MKARVLMVSRLRVYYMYKKKGRKQTLEYKRERSSVARFCKLLNKFIS